ncbi:MAG TPA: CopD family protein [Burkholderiaceae bacterium]|nr:CopD family protein [Burkholderiaceae bacterium]
MMAWLLASHIVFLVVWAAGLFYIPVLCAVGYQEHRSRRVERLRIRIRFAFVAITSPAAVLTIVSGTALVFSTGADGAWMAAKLTMVALMAVFHAFCGHLLNLLGHEGRRHQRIHSVGGWTLAVPMVLIPAVLWLVLAKPAII